tara:strand:+ start:1355 stop:2407 length:1053 start_codon:yes stop_codon:yes gene_type:complete
MSETNNEATQTDESSVNDFDFDALADEVLGLEPDTANQESDEATEELEGEDHNTDEDADEVDDAENDNEGEEEEEEDESEDATQESESDELGEVDMDFRVPVKIDGKQSEVTMEELVANYQTKQSQSKKGDELAEQAKVLDSTREQAEIYARVNAELINREDAKDISVLEHLQKQVDKAFEEDDYQASKLNNKLGKAKEEYSTRKTSRDNLLNGMSQQLGQQQQEQFGKQVEHFNTVVPDLIPDWSEDVAMANREFALSIGLNEQVVDTMTDPMMVKAIDNFRRLSENSSKGTAKRKQAPVKRVPTKKPTTAKNKKSNKIDAARKNASRGRASEQDSKVLFDNVIDSIFE